MREFVSKAQRDPVRRREQFWWHRASKAHVDLSLCTYLDDMERPFPAITEVPRSTRRDEDPPVWSFRMNDLEDDRFWEDEQQKWSDVCDFALEVVDFIKWVILPENHFIVTFAYLSLQWTTLFGRIETGGLEGIHRKLLFDKSCDENRSVRILPLAGAGRYFANGQNRNWMYYEELMQIKFYWHTIYQQAFFKVQKNVNRIASFWAQKYFHKKDEQAAQLEFIIQLAKRYLAENGTDSEKNKSNI